MNPRVAITVLGAMGFTQALVPDGGIVVTGAYVVVSAGLIATCVKAILVFGRMEKTQEIAGTQFQEFAAEVRAMLLRHDRDISVLQTTQGDHERRLGEERRQGTRRASHRNDP